MTKQCTTCQQEHDLSQFNKREASEDGLQNVCRECNKLRSRQYYKENREKHIRIIGKAKRITIQKNRQRVLSYLTEHSCVDCGESDPVVLEFDHVRGHKEESISHMVLNASSWHRIEMEIEKCQVRCCNCHRRMTYKRRHTPPSDNSNRPNF